MVMSALPPKADMCGATRDVCFGPIADIAVATPPFGIKEAANLGGLDYSLLFCANENHLNCSARG